ncbi:hypothetical protein IMZ48_23835 [Candidatus Bathyarchaeota archaeon]|nr:hypothetical protein [Candidatus Bathyarchaeota archaeon]
MTYTQKAHTTAFPISRIPLKAPQPVVTMGSTGARWICALFSLFLSVKEVDREAREYDGEKDGQAGYGDLGGQIHPEPPIGEGLVLGGGEVGERVEVLLGQAEHREQDQAGVSTRACVGWKESGGNAQAST